jgi:uncharacterized protein
MRNRALIDSGFLYALFDADDRYHIAVQAVRQLDDTKALVPDVILVEATFLARSDGKIESVLELLDAFNATDFELVALTRDDVRRARDIMADYPEARLDFVDCCIMAMAERLNITRIYTIDPRDYYIFRPKHCEYLDILP